MYHVKAGWLRQLLSAFMIVWTFGLCKKKVVSNFSILKWHGHIMLFRLFYSNFWFLFDKSYHMIYQMKGIIILNNLSYWKYSLLQKLSFGDFFIIYHKKVWNASHIWPQNLYLTLFLAITFFEDSLNTTLWDRIGGIKSPGGGQVGIQYPTAYIS